MFKQRKMTWVCLLALGLSLGAAPQRASAAGVKELLDLVPADAWGFAVAQSLDRIDKKADLLRTSVGLPIPEQVTMMALGALQLGDTIDRTGAIAAVMMDAQKFASPDKAAVLLVSASDPAKLLENLQAAEPEEGIHRCTVMGEAAFAAVKGKVVILGPSADCVKEVSKAKKTMGGKIAKARVDVLGKSDLFLSISVRAITNAYKDMFLPMVQMMMAATDPEGKQVKVFEKLLTEVAAMDLAFLFDDDGLALRILIAPQDGSDMETLIGDEETTGDPLLAGLPAEKFFLSMGGVSSHSEVSEKFGGGGGSFADIVRMAGLEGTDAEVVEKLDKTLEKLAKSVKRYCLSIGALPGGSDGMVGLALVVETDDAKVFVDGLRKAFETVWKVTDDEDVSTVKESIVHKADAETIDGEPVDTITIDLKGLAELSESDAAEVEKAQLVLGKECIVRFGAVGSDRVVVAYGGGKGRFKEIRKSIKDAGSGLARDQGIGAMSGRLPTPRSGEWYLAVDNILQFVKAVTKALGEEEEFPFEVPTVNAPVAGSTTVQDNVMRFDLMVPMKLIQAGKEAYDSYAAQSAEEDFDEGMGEEDEAEDDQPDEDGGEDE